MKHSTSNLPAEPRNRLDGFDTFDSFLHYAKNMFDLSQEEYRLLYQVLIKLENVGQDPLEALDQCKYGMREDDCLDMLKFLMHVEASDLQDLLGGDSPKKP